MSSTVLITGVQGLLGRRLASLLLRQGFAVHGTGRRGNHDLDPSIHYRPIDLATRWQLADLPDRCDFVIHLAQSANFRDFPDSAVDVFKVNIESTAYLLDYARSRGVKKFIYASTGGVYGNGKHPFKENAPIIPSEQLGYYIGSKACGEVLVQSYASLFDVVVVRPFFVYGPGQKREMLIPRLFDSVACGQAITLQGDSGIRINPIHVNDAAAAIASALDLNESATFNIAGPDVLSIREICEGIGHYLSIKPVFERRPGEPNDLIADISAMKQELVVPRYSLLSSFKDVAALSGRLSGR